MFQRLRKYIIHRAIIKEKNLCEDQMKQMIQAKNASIGYANNVVSPRSGGITFRLQAGIGGHVMTVSRYDENTGNNNERMYVIAEAEDLGDSISKIITLEGLRS